MYKEILIKAFEFNRYALNKIAKTIYHGTSINRARQIMKEDLIPQAGSWVQNTYGLDIDLESDNEYYEGWNEPPIFDLVFGADKETISSVIGGMKSSIAAETGKKFHEITEEDIRALGAVVVVKDGDNYFKQRPARDSSEEKDWYYYEEGERYPTVEPGDYYSEQQVPASYILTGKPLIRLLKRYDSWPLTKNTQ